MVRLVGVMGKESTCMQTESCAAKNGEEERGHVFLSFVELRLSMNAT